MKNGLWLLLLIKLTTVFAAGGREHIFNKTVPRNIVTNLIDDGWENDPFMEEAQQTCQAGRFTGCFKSTAVSTLVQILNKEKYEISNNARFVRVPPASSDAIKMEGLDFSQQPRAGQSFFEEVIGFLSRRADHFIKSTGLEIDLTDEITEGGKYQPKFIDEIYSEIDTLEDKNEKPDKRYEFKKLFIPFLIIMKMFKLKLLVLLPVILGFASFKKILAFLVILIPGIIGYFKVCKPDIGSTYGSFGHSSYYHSPPILSSKYNDYSPPTHLSYREQQEAQKLVYKGYRNR